jgi:hypothetical protein
MDCWEVVPRMRKNRGFWSKKKLEVEDKNHTAFNAKKLQEYMNPQNLIACGCRMVRCGKQDKKDAVSFDKESNKGMFIGFWTAYAIIAAGFVFVNIWMLHTWYVHKHDSPSCEYNLPLWLLVSGSVGIAGWGITLFGHIAREAIFSGADKEKEENKGEVSTKAKAGVIIMLVQVGFAVVMLLFDIMWTVLGSFWVYSINRSSHVCAESMYKFTWWYVTIYWGLLGAALITCCVLCGIAMSNMIDEVKNFVTEVFTEDEDMKKDRIKKNTEKQAKEAAAAAPASGGAASPPASTG